MLNRVLGIGLTCFACVGHGRQVETSTALFAGGKRTRFQGFIKSRRHSSGHGTIFAALNIPAIPLEPCRQTAAFNLCGLGSRLSVSKPTRGTLHPAVLDNRRGNANAAAGVFSAALSDIQGGFLEGFPFLGADAFAEKAQYSGFGINVAGREPCSIALAVWQQQLPVLLRGFNVLSVKMLPPDARSIVKARYTVGFDAPLPPQVLPAQRDRIRDANLTLTADGLVPVQKTISATLLLDTNGKVIRFIESLEEADVFEVTATLARFELVYAHHLALSGGSFGILEGAKAYWAAFRDLTREELDQTARSGQSDELRVLVGDADGATDEQYEQAFSKLLLTGFLRGGAFGVVLYYGFKALREFASGLF